MKLNTNGNVYTIVYASVMVIIVALLLAVVSAALKPRQDANVKLDTQKQILASLNLRTSRQYPSSRPLSTHSPATTP